jgi:hypothetical protein
MSRDPFFDCLIRGHHRMANASTWAQCVDCGWPTILPLGRPLNADSLSEAKP